MNYTWNTTQYDLESAKNGTKYWVSTQNATNLSNFSWINKSEIRFDRPQIDAEGKNWGHQDCHSFWTTKMKAGQKQKKSNSGPPEFIWKSYTIECFPWKNTTNYSTYPDGSNASINITSVKRNATVNESGKISVDQVGWRNDTIINQSTGCRLSVVNYKQWEIIESFCPHNASNGTHIPGYVGWTNLSRRTYAGHPHYKTDSELTRENYSRTIHRTGNGSWTQVIVSYGDNFSNRTVHSYD